MGQFLMFMAEILISNMILLLKKRTRGAKSLLAKTRQACSLSQGEHVMGFDQSKDPNQNRTDSLQGFANRLQMSHTMHTTILTLIVDNCFTQTLDIIKIVEAANSNFVSSPFFVGFQHIL